MHTPVLLEKALATLGPKPGEFWIDGTVDGGGHAEALLDRIAPEGKLLGIDWDPQMIEISRTRFGARKNVILETGNYADLPMILEKRELGKADGLFLDLGFSSNQIDEAGRGFSFMKEGPLTMTYSPEAEPVTALIGSLDEKSLAHIIFTYGGERMSRRIAKAIYDARRKKPIRTTSELATVVRNALPKRYEGGRIDPATRTFQALRIYANDELGNLEKLLGELPQIVKRGGRIGIIAFHSLEDRIVKQKFRALEKEGIVSIITKKPLEADDEEINKNPRSRSAKLRAAVIQGLGDRV